MKNMLPKTTEERLISELKDLRRQLEELKSNQQATVTIYHDDVNDEDRILIGRQVGGF
jgi:hypothetical protein